MRTDDRLPNKSEKIRGTRDRLEELGSIKVEGWIVITQLCVLIGLHFCDISPVLHL